MDALVVLKPSVSVCLVRDTRGSKERGHDPGDPVGEKIINQLGAEQNCRGADTHACTVPPPLVAHFDSTETKKNPRKEPFFFSYVVLLPSVSHLNAFANQLSLSFTHPHTAKAAIRQHLQSDVACFSSLLLLQLVPLINEEVLGPQLLISAYRLSVHTANQSRPSDSWFMKNVACVGGGGGGGGALSDLSQVTAALQHFCALTVAILM